MAGTCSWREPARGGNLLVAATCSWRQPARGGNLLVAASARGGICSVVAALVRRDTCSSRNLFVARNPLVACSWRNLLVAEPLFVAEPVFVTEPARGGTCSWRDLLVAGLARGGTCSWRHLVGCGGTCSWRHLFVAEPARDRTGLSPSPSRPSDGISSWQTVLRAAESAHDGTILTPGGISSCGWRTVSRAAKSACGGSNQLVAARISLRRTVLRPRRIKLCRIVLR